MVQNLSIWQAPTAPWNKIWACFYTLSFIIVGTGMNVLKWTSRRTQQTMPSGFFSTRTTSLNATPKAYYSLLGTFRENPLFGLSIVSQLLMIIGALKSFWERLNIRLSSSLTLPCGLFTGMAILIILSGIILTIYSWFLEWRLQLLLQITSSIQNSKELRLPTLSLVFAIEVVSVATIWYLQSKSKKVTDSKSIK